MTRKILILLITALFSWSYVHAEDYAQIQTLFDSIRDSRSDSVKMLLHQRLTDEIGSMLEAPNSFTNSYSQLTNLGKIYSDDKLVRIYTWSFPLEDKSYQYGGFIQYKTKNKVTTTPLLLLAEPTLPNETQRLDNKHWYGSLYYKVFKVKKKKETYYIALGWSGYTAATDFKVVEPLSFDKNGKLTALGKAVFKGRTKRPTLRYVMEYNSVGKAALNYQPERGQIIFDHLMPIEPIYEGIRSYYGPDFTYDAFSLKKGEWFYEENIDARNK